jgi:hypothetical protein
MTTPNWRLIAAHKFIGIAVHGSGRFAVLACDRRSCWLCPTEDNAKAASLGGCYMNAGRCECNHAIIDLQPCPLPAKERPDDYEDRQWLKRNA